MVERLDRALHWAIKTRSSMEITREKPLRNIGYWATSLDNRGG